MLPILIDLPESDAAGQHAEELLAACREVSTMRSCQRAPNPRSSTARVRWLEGGRVAVVDAWIGGQWRTRRLQFSDRDETSERWRAAGLVVGSVFEAAAVLPGSEPTPEPKPATTMTSPPPEPDQPRLSTWRLALGGLTGSGLFDGTLRWGGFTRVVVRPARFPLGLAAVFSVAWAPTREGLTARWLTGTAGPVALWDPTDDLTFEVGVELGREQLWVGLDATELDPQQSATRAYLTLAGRLLARWRLTDHCGVTGGFGAHTTPGQPIRIAGEPQTDNPRPALSVLLGVQVER